MLRYISGNAALSRKNTKKGELRVNTVILTLNSKYIHSSLAPWYLAAAVKEIRAGATINVIESTINRTVSDTFEEVRAVSPQLLACSCYIWNIEKTLEIAKKNKKEVPEAVIVLGGPEVGYRAEDVLNRYTFVDAVISGEGETPFKELYCSLSEGGSFVGIAGVSYRTVAGLHIAEPCIGEGEPPSPYSEEYLSALQGRIAYIEGSRGCPFRCAFCLSGRCGTVRYFGLSRVIDDIKLLGNSGAKTIKFVDRTFNANRKRAIDIWSYIIENSGKLWPRDVCFHFEIAGDLLDKESLELLQTAPRGIIQVEIGLQSFNEKTLRSINRTTDVEKLCSNIKRLISFGNIHTHIDLIAGLPYEDIESFEDSFNTAYYMYADNLQLGFLKLLYGAPMREERELYPCEFSAQPPYEITATPWLTEEDIKTLKYAEDSLERLYNSGRFKNTLRYLVEELKLNPFALFKNIGVAVGNVENVSLNEYTDRLFQCLSVYEKTDNGTLRDCLVMDKLTADASGYIPKCLQVADPMLKACKREFNRIYGSGKKLGIAILYQGTPRAICVDYSKLNASGNYMVYTRSLSEQTDNKSVGN